MYVHIHIYMFYIYHINMCIYMYFKSFSLHQKYLECVTYIKNCNNKQRTFIGSEEKVLTQIPLQGSENRSDVKENKELGGGDWGEKAGSSIFCYKNFGNQQSKWSYETEKVSCFRNMWKEKTFS